MRFNVLPWKPVLVALVAVLLWSAPANAAGKTAVVDIVKTMQSHPRTKIVEDAFQASQKKAEDDLNRQDKDIQALKMQLEGMPAEAPERIEKEKRYQLLVSNAKFNYEWDMRLAVREYVLGLERIYGAVRGEIGRYAREQGLDVVLQYTPTSTPLRAGDPKDFALKTRLRAVLYAATEVDITAAIIKRIKDKNK